MAYLDRRRGSAGLGVAARTPLAVGRTTAVIAVGLTLGFAACRRFTPVPLSADETSAALEHRSLSDPGLRAYLDRVAPGRVRSWPCRRWDLDALTLAAFYYQPSLGVSRAQWRVAGAGQATAGARPNPSLLVTPQYVANSPHGVVPWDITSMLDWPIETAGKRDRRIEEATHRTTSARLALDAAAWLVRSDVRARMLDVVASHAQSALRTREYAIRREMGTLLEQRAAAGAASRAEVAPQRAAELQAAVDLSDAERQEGDARSRLAEAVGVPGHALDGVKIEFSLDGQAPDVDRPADELRRTALLERADVRAALADYAAAEAALRLEIARQYPDLRVGPGYEYDQGLNKWAVVGVSIELPVLNRNEGPIGEAEARRAEVAARFLGLQATVLAAFDRALADREQTTVARARTQALLVTAREQLRAAKQAFTHGATDRLGVLDAELLALQAERTHLDAQVRAQQALGDLEATVQPPLRLELATTEGETP
jgi:cobalt-zinc-cadmium efflux system outer membrane protein